MAKGVRDDVEKNDLKKWRDTMETKVESMDKKLDALLPIASSVTTSKQTARKPLALASASNGIGEAKKFFAHAEIALGNQHFFTAVNLALSGFERYVRVVADELDIDHEKSVAAIVKELNEHFGNDVFAKAMSQLMQRRSNLVDISSPSSSFDKVQAESAVTAFRAGTEFLGREIERLRPKPIKRVYEREEWIAGY